MRYMSMIVRYTIHRSSVVQDEIQSILIQSIIQHSLEYSSENNSAQFSVFRVFAHSHILRARLSSPRLRRANLNIQYGGHVRNFWIYMSIYVNVTSVYCKKYTIIKVIFN